jgi:hypothetical protein
MLQFCVVCKTYFKILIFKHKYHTNIHMATIIISEPKKVHVTLQTTPIHQIQL